MRLGNGGGMGLTQAEIDSGPTAEPVAPESSSATAVATRPASPPPSSAIARILGLEVTLSVILAARNMTIESILKTTTGTIMEFDVPFDAELSINIGGHTIGLGQTVKIGENFGLRLTQLVGVSERAGAMGG